MNLKIVYRDIESTEALESHIHECSQELEHLVDPNENIKVIVGVTDKGSSHYAEVFWHCNLQGKDFFAKEEGNSLYHQIENAFEKVAKQARSERDKTIDSRRRTNPPKKNLGSE